MAGDQGHRRLSRPRANCGKDDQPAVEKGFRSAGARQGMSISRIKHLFDGRIPLLAGADRSTRRAQHVTARDDDPHAILSTRSDFFTQAALRVLPGFPHGIINYSAGLLRLPPRAFLLAAVLGLAVKWAMYCWSIHALFQRGLGGEGPGTGALLALVMLTLFLGIGSWITHRLKARASAAGDPQGE
jgi:hypothetical protein